MFSANNKAVTTHVQSVSAETRTFSAKLEDFVKLSCQNLAQLKTESQQYQAKEVEALNGISVRITEQLEKVRDALKIIHAKDDAADAAVCSIQTAVEETQETVKSGFSLWAEELRIHCEATCKQTEATSLASFASVSPITLV